MSYKYTNFTVNKYIKAIIEYILKYFPAGGYWLQKVIAGNT